MFEESASQIDRLLETLITHVRLVGGESLCLFDRLGDGLLCGRGFAAPLAVSGELQHEVMERVLSRAGRAWSAHVGDIAFEGPAGKLALRYTLASAGGSWRMELEPLGD
jgi:hypothetical protein